MDPKSVFEILVNEHADMLHIYLRAVVRDAAAVDDLFQETMLTAWRKLDDFDRSRSFGRWLRGIAARHVMAHRRKSAKQIMLCDERVLEHLDRRLDQIGGHQGDTWSEKLEGLRHCTEQLPDRYREVVDLRYRDAVSVADLAKLLSISREAIKKRLQRARARLLDCLERKYAEGSA